MLTQYADCNWDAVGDLTCNGGVRQHTMGMVSPENYSSLSRELDVSVYSLKGSFGGFTPAPPVVETNASYVGYQSQMLQPTRSSQITLQPYQGQPYQGQPYQGHPLQSGGGGGGGAIHWSQTTTRSSKKSNPYYFQTPYQKYFELVEEFGQPTLLDPNRGGLAIWLRLGIKNPRYSIFERVDLLDEETYNTFPYPHVGFLYTYVRMKISTDQLNKVLSISGDVNYDPIKQLLCVRGMSLGYNTALTTIIARYVRGDLSWYRIIDGNLIRKVTSHKRLMNPKYHERNLKLLASSKSFSSQDV
jgi:hypothetical protein